MAASSAWLQVLQAVRDRIIGLAPTGITTTNIVAMLIGDDQEGSGPEIGGYPAVVCCNGGPETISESDGTNASDDIVFPVSVVILATENRATTNLDRNLVWRDSIIAAFQQKRLSGVTIGHAWKCVARPGTPGDRPRWLQQQHAQVVVIYVTVRKQNRP